MKLSVIITTRHPESWLDKTLTGFALQTWRDFEVIVADAAPASSIAGLIAGREHGYPVPLRHVCREDAGRPGRNVLDKAITLAAHEYLLFTDGDCIPRRDFVAVHAEQAERGRFLSGSCCRLGADLSRHISRNDIVRGRCFELEWLQAHEPLSASKRRKLGASPAAARLLDRVTPGVDFDERNGSAWKQDLLALTPFRRSAERGRPDAGLGRRLDARGIRGKRIRHKAVCLQLDHECAPGRDAAAATSRGIGVGGGGASAAPWAM